MQIRETALMDTTPNLDLPYIMGAQAQKHVTHNEAIRKLDALVQLTILDRDLTTPPAAPADGDRYIVAAGASGAWAGQDGEVAAFQDGAWAFYPPAEGWLAWLADETALIAWDGSAWVAVGSASINPAPLVGVNTTADTTNRLAAKSDAVLFSHDDVTPGTGDQRTILNKAAAEKTASFLFQSNWSGRAEVGLTGNDDFSFKVSPDDGTWHEALVLKRDGSAITAGLPVQHGKPPKLPAYTISTLPSASTFGSGSLIYVSDWPDGGAVLMSDGLRWRRAQPHEAKVADLLGGDEGIAIDFRAREALINDYADVLTTRGRPADVLTLTRASDATFVGRNGLLETADSNALRFTYGPVAREPRGLLVEGSATNMCLHSQEADNAFWNKSNLTVNADDALAPDGTATADRLTNDTTNGSHSISKSVSGTVAQKWTFSRWVKAGTGRYVLLRIIDDTGNNYVWAVFDLQTVTVYSSGNTGLASGASADIEVYADGWCRIALTGQPSTSGSSVNGALFLQEAPTNSAVYAGTGVTLWTWGAQLEQGNGASSYIPTTNATATRAADSLTIGPDTFPVLPAGDCTLYWRGRLRSVPSASGSALQAQGIVSSERVQIRQFGATSAFDLAVVDDGSSQADTAGFTVTLGNICALAASVHANDLKYFANGSAVDTVAALSMPTIDRLAIAPGSGAVWEIDGIAYIARALGAAELAALTAV